MTPDTITLSSFLLARIAEDEEAALDAAGWDRSGRERATGRWTHVGVASVDDDQGRMVVYSDSDQLSPSTAAHIARHDPARVLAECAAKRAIVEMFTADYDERGLPSGAGGYGEAYCEALQHLAAVYSDHPDYREAWRP